MSKTITNGVLTLETREEGGEIVSLKKDGKEYVWCGDPAFWGRRAPVLFPFVGSLAGKQYKHNGQVYPMGQHGFARDCKFTLTEEREDFLRYELTSDAATRENYPFDFLLGIEYTLKENVLTNRWTVKNTGKEPMPFSIGGHPAFMCPLEGNGDWEDYRIRFEKNGERKPWVEWHTIAEGGLIRRSTTAMRTERGDITPTDALFAGDALVIEDQQCDAVSLVGPEGNPYLTVRFDAPLFGVWSPTGKHAPFICIEPWWGRADGVGFKGTLEERAYGQILQVGEEFTAAFDVVLA